MFKGFIIFIVVLGLTACQSERALDVPETEVLADAGSREAADIAEEEEVSAPEADEMGDHTLHIVSVTPETVTEGGKVTIAVTVRYHLAGSSGAQVSVGFNTEVPNEYISGVAPVVVEAGTGEVTIETEVVPVLWSEELNHFGVNAILSEYAHGTMWQPLVSQQQAITVEPYVYHPVQSAYAQSSGRADAANHVCYSDAVNEMYCVSYAR